MSSGSEASLCSQQPGLNTRDRIGVLRRPAICILVSQLRRTLHNWDYAEDRIMWFRARLTAVGLVAGPAARRTRSA
jgi:hypothetical protein